MKNLKNSALNYAIQLIGILELIDDEDFINKITDAVIYNEEYLLEEMQENLQSEVEE